MKIAILAENAAINYFIIIIYKLNVGKIYNILIAYKFEADNLP